jgi:DNA uptake protein ComE-like DNA-binding protein
MANFYRYLFTRSEMRGILILSLGVILIRLLAYSISPLMVSYESSQLPGVDIDSIQQLKQKPKTIEINSADSVALLELNGIGPVFAKRILKYRQMLGGFAFKRQLLEVYGMDTIRLSGFLGQIRLDTMSLKKIDLNKATFKELLAHPYLDYDQVKAIARYRDRKGIISSPGELWAAGILPDSLWVGLKHYLAAPKDSNNNEK